MASLMTAKAPWTGCGREMGCETGGWEDMAMLCEAGGCSGKLRVWAMYPVWALFASTQERHTGARPWGSCPVRKRTSTARPRG